MQLIVSPFRWVSPSRWIPPFASLSLIATSGLAAIPLKEVHQVVPLDANGELSLTTFKGIIKMTAWDRAEVKLDASIQPGDESSSCGSEEEKAERVRRTDVKIETSPGSVRVKTDYDQLTPVGNPVNQCVSRPFVNYEIKLPANARIRIADHKSTIEIADLHGAITIATHKGKLDLRGIEGPLELNTHKSEGRVAFNKLSRPSQISSHKGDIEVSLPRSGGFELDANVGRKGELQSDFAETNRTGKGQYRGSVNGGGPALRLNTFKGHFRLRQA